MGLLTRRFPTYRVEGSVLQNAISRTVVFLSAKFSKSKVHKSNDAMGIHEDVVGLKISVKEYRDTLMHEF